MIRRVIFLWDKHWKQNQTQRMGNGAFADNEPCNSWWQSNDVRININHEEEFFCFPKTCRINATSITVQLMWAVDHNFCWWCFSPIRQNADVTHFLLKHRVPTIFSSEAPGPKLMRCTRINCTCVEASAVVTYFSPSCHLYGHNVSVHPAASHDVSFVLQQPVVYGTDAFVSGPVLAGCQNRRAGDKPAQVRVEHDLKGSSY